MTKAAELIITHTLENIPGTVNWTPGSCREVAEKILENIALCGGTIIFPIKEEIEK